MTIEEFESLTFTKQIELIKSGDLPEELLKYLDRYEYDDETGGDFGDLYADFDV